MSQSVRHHLLIVQLLLTASPHHLSTRPERYTHPHVFHRLQVAEQEFPASENRASCAHTSIFCRLVCSGFWRADPRRDIGQIDFLSRSLETKAAAPCARAPARMSGGWPGRCVLTRATLALLADKNSLKRKAQQRFEAWSSLFLLLFVAKHLICSSLGSLEN